MTIPQSSHSPGASGMPATNVEYPAQFRLGHAGGGGGGGHGSGGGTGMTEISREEVEAKLETVEARTETKFAQLSGKIETMAATLTGQMGQVLDAAKRGEDEAREAKRAATNTKWNILFTALATIALVFSVWALWAQGMDLIASLLNR